MADENTQVQETQATEPAQATQPVAADKDKEQPTTPVQDTNAQVTQPAEPAKDDKPKEVKPVIFWISGMINGQQVDCDGPYSTMQDDPKLHIYPYTTVAPNPQFTYQKFDYMAQKWVDISAPTVEQTVGDLKQDVNSLKQTVATVQTNSQTNSQEFTASLKEVKQGQDQLGKSITQLTAMMSQMLVKQATPPAQTTQPTQVTQTTNGGDK